MVIILLERKLLDLGQDIWIFGWTLRVGRKSWCLPAIFRNDGLKELITIEDAGCIFLFFL